MLQLDNLCQQIKSPVPERLSVWPNSSHRNLQTAQAVAKTTDCSPRRDLLLKLAKIHSLKTQVCLCPGENYFSSQHSLVGYASFCRAEAFRDFLWPMIPFLLLSVFSSCFGSHVDETLWVYFLIFLGGISHHKLHDLLALTSFIPLLLHWVCSVSMPSHAYS